MDNQKGMKQSNYDNVPFSDRQKDGLNGPVKQTKQVMYEAFERNAEVFITGMTSNYASYYQTNMIKYYSESGILLEIVRFSADKFERSRETDLFQGHDLGGCGTFRFYDIEGKESSRTEFYLNEKGEHYETREYKYSEYVNRIEYKLNTAEQIESVSTYDKHNNLTTKDLTLYDKYGYAKERKTIDGNGKITYWTKIKHTAKGYLKEITQLDENEKVIFNHSYANSFDNKGDYTSTEEDLSQDNDPERVFKEEFEFDHHKNWVQKKVYYADMVLMSIEIREIDYYGEEHLKAYISIDEWLSKPFDIQTTVLAPCKNHNHDLINCSSFESFKYYFGEAKQYTPLFSLIDCEWLASLAPSNQDFSALGYYVLKNKIYPTIIQFKELIVDAYALLKYLIQVGGEIVSSHSEYNEYNHGHFPKRYTIGFAVNRAYLVDIPYIKFTSPINFDVPKHLYANSHYDYSIPDCTVHLYVPTNENEINEENGLEATIISCIQKARLYEKPNKPEINMIETDETGNFQINSHLVKDNFEIKDLNLHYGQDFLAFHTELMNRFEHETQGLVLFHGLPGTGKTYYIRHLLKELAYSKKKVIYLPPNMVDHLTDPVFITFLSRTIAQFSASASFCVLLIEDAEPLLATRTPDVRIQGVTNLLNMTDGLLNDVLKLQIICTFNVELNELDSALLRPGRLIARKEFKPLPVIDANLLAINLGINHHFSEPTTLAEIYAEIQSRHTILHEEN